MGWKMEEDFGSLALCSLHVETLNLFRLFIVRASSICTFASADECPQSVIIGRSGTGTSSILRRKDRCKGR
jgi:hypothetical protein